ncbi:Bcd1 protein [Martiniozyma asiatica (nom. inval.)]|nr:Bcd1 protein [Martiniozyma asiatica]
MEIKTRVEEEENIKPSSLKSIETCLYCTEKPKYTCPKCQSLTCCLEHYKKHKDQLSCSGKSELSTGERPYKPVKTLEETDMRRDYSMLQNVSRELTLGKRKRVDGDEGIPFIQAPSKSNSGLNEEQPVADDGKNFTELLLAQNSMKDMKDIWKKRRLNNSRPVKTDNEGNNDLGFNHDYIPVRGVRVLKTPPAMSRAKMNKSGGDKRKNTFNWTVEMVWINNDWSVIERKILDRVEESSALGSCIPNEWLSKAKEMIKETSSDDDNYEPTIPNQMADYDSNSSKFNFYITSFPNKERSLFTSSVLLKDAIVGKTVVEFPTFYVCLDEVKDKISKFAAKKNSSNGDSSSDSSDSSDSRSDSDSTDTSSDDDDDDEDDEAE